jgi:hypothetical protein
LLRSRVLPPFPKRELDVDNIAALDPDYEYGPDDFDEDDPYSDDEKEDINDGAGEVIFPEVSEYEE